MWILWVMAAATFILGIGNIVFIFTQIPHIVKFGNRAGNVDALVQCALAMVVCFAASALNVWVVTRAR
jgi:hypothetical protein